MASPPVHRENEEASHGELLELRNFRGTGTQLHPRFTLYPDKLSNHQFPINLMAVADSAARRWNRPKTARCSTDVPPLAPQMSTPVPPLSSICRATVLALYIHAVPRAPAASELNASSAVSGFRRADTNSPHEAKRRRFAYRQVPRDGSPRDGRLSSPAGRLPKAATRSRDALQRPLQDQDRDKQERRRPARPYQPKHSRFKIHSIERREAGRRWRADRERRVSVPSATVRCGTRNTSHSNEQSSGFSMRD